MGRGNLSFRRRTSAKQRLVRWTLTVILLASGAFAFSRLMPQTVLGQVLDASTNMPVEGAIISFRQNAILADSFGAFSVAAARIGDRVEATAPGYLKQKFSIENSSLLLYLQPRVITGAITDKETGTTIHGATVSAISSFSRSDNGRFNLTHVPEEATLTVTAAGYKRAELQLAPDQDSLEVSLEPIMAKAIYVNFYAMQDQAAMDSLTEFVNETVANAMVLDIKSDYGLIAEGIDAPQAANIGAVYNLVDDFPGFIRQLKHDDIYLIARLVTFKDDLFATARPDLALKIAGTNVPFRDCERLQWLDPFQKESWDYNIEIAVGAAKLGFDEIQFDYVRFPSDCLRGNLAYQDDTVEGRAGAIAGFLAEAQRRLKPLGVATSADIFGWITMKEDDLGIGQRLEDMAANVDYIAPMVYPSTWGAGSLGIAYPPGQPYDIVYSSLANAAKRLQKVPGARIRAWLQDFDDYQRRNLKYGPAELEAQIKAAEDAGSKGWMLWDPFMSYNID